MSESLHLHPRPRGAGNCVYCREPLGEVDRLVRCSACNVALHRDCRAELTECPTIGCAGDGVAATDDEWRRWNREVERHRGGEAPRRPGLLELLTPAQLVGLVLVGAMVLFGWLAGALADGPEPEHASIDVAAQFEREAAEHRRIAREAHLRAMQDAAWTQLSRAQARAREVVQLARSEHGALGTVRAYVGALRRGDAAAAARFLSDPELTPASLTGLTRWRAHSPRWERHADGRTRVRVLLDVGGAARYALIVEPQPPGEGGWQIVAIEGPSDVPDEAR